MHPTTWPTSERARAASPSIRAAPSAARACRCSGTRHFVEAVLGKLANALKMAESQGLVLIILGDLLDAGDNTDIRMLTQGTRVLRSCWRTPWYLVGNHTLTIGRRSIHKDLPDGHALALLAESGTLRLLGGDGDPDFLWERPRATSSSEA
jgi:hypothetical protein